MKKSIIGILALVLSSMSFAQENALPTTGNVGMGTLNPTHRLQVNGNVKVDSCIVVTDSMIMETNARIGEDLKIEGNLFIPNIQDIGANDKKYLTIDANGQVKSMTKSNIIADVYSSDCFLDDAPAGGTPTYQTPIWQSASSNVPNSPVGYLFTGTQCPALVGIGTDTPTQHLDVRGSGYFSQNLGLGIQPNPSAQLISFTDKEVGICIEHNWSGSFGYAFKSIVNSDQTKGIGIYSNVHNKDVFTVYGDGKVVIENASGPTFQLESNGLLRARHVRVDVDTWPDYVFESEYDLTSLEETKKYIEENGHLPNIPSAEVMEDGGMDVAKMNKLLLEKIEELTLHLIEQSERISELEQQLEK